MNKTHLLCTFTSKYTLGDTLENINDIYDIIFKKIYVLTNRYNRKELMCTYNVFDGSTEMIKDTILIHRKKQSNTLYTINALNNIIINENGKLDPSYGVDWDRYRNSLLVTNDGILKRIHTKIFDIIEN